MDPKTRRLVQLEIKAGDNTNKLLDMLLGKKRASDRKNWLEKNGDKAEVI
jgi:topoisomerase-4 subunit B